MVSVSWSYLCLPTTSDSEWRWCLHLFTWTWDPVWPFTTLHEQKQQHLQLSGDLEDWLVSYIGLGLPGVPLFCTLGTGKASGVVLLGPCCLERWHHVHKTSIILSLTLQSSFNCPTQLHYSSVCIFNIWMQCRSDIPAPACLWRRQDKLKH